MARNNRDNSFEESRFPQGTVVLAALVVLLGAGVFLIIKGLVA